jgi:hypothetical protein
MEVVAVADQEVKVQTGEQAATKDVTADLQDRVVLRAMAMEMEAAVALREEGKPKVQAGEQEAARVGVAVAIPMIKTIWVEAAVNPVALRMKDVAEAEAAPGQEEGVPQVLPQADAAVAMIGNSGRRLKSYHY